MKKVFKECGLTIVMLSLFILFLWGQSHAGFEEHNNFLKEHGKEALSYFQYLTSGHFIQSTFENWESEFLQMGLFIYLTAFLRQRGSSESLKMPDEKGAADEKKEKVTKDSPWPVRKGGWILKLYENSLSLALFLLFIISFFIHAYGGMLEANEENAIHGKDLISFGDFIKSEEFWFQSLQNWQSEFLAVAVIVVLSIFLRQKGSSQSKRVSAAHRNTGEDAD